MMTTHEDPPIVGIGASAGGVKALQSFFEALPPNTGAAFVAILHLDPEARSELANIIATRTAMPVMQVESSHRLEPNHVYVIAPNCQLRISDHTISAVPFYEARGHRAPIDLFFLSLAEQHSDGFAIVLTGAGHDGAMGVRAIKEAGGIVLVQHPEEAEYSSMPRSAIATEVADFVLPLHALVERLVELLGTHGQVSRARLDKAEEETIKRILAQVRMRTGHDFSQYKRATIVRRIARRVQVTRKNSLEDYASYLRENVEEAQSLLSDFLISVTTFFRDPKAFTALAREIIPQLFEAKGAGDVIRVWVPGCATGEEAYTIGILLLEEASRRQIRPEIQVFASDLDTGALAVGREGRYPATVEAHVSEERLRRYFQVEGDHYRIRRELRDIVLFASHSLLRDPPFSRLDFVSCRNLLIYLDRDLQRQACIAFHYALNPGGFLLLGASESGDQAPGLFRTVDRDARIFRSIATPPHQRPALPIPIGSHGTGDRAAVGPRTTVSRGNVGDASLHRQMLERIAPPSMLIDESHRAVHLSESVGRFLQFSGGPVSADATELVRPELRFDLRSALHRAFERGESSVSVPIFMRFDGEPRRVLLHVKPVRQDNETSRYALALFIEGAAETVSEMTEDEPDGARIGTETVRQLQEELHLVRLRLQATREESEGTNEELRAANEELQSINEEYRSTSEELETSKEELQSINEELQTVNNELKIKLDTVSRAHSDLQNLMAATDVATLFLDPALRIKRFTPRLMQLFNVTQNDEGRPITDFTHQLEYDGLAENARAVLHDLVPSEHEAHSRDGGWYLIRMRPYRTIEDKIDGVVATFLDITALRQSEERLRQEMRLVELSRSPIFVWDFDGGVLKWNRGSEELYGFSREEALGQRKEQLLRTTVPGGSFDELRKVLLDTGTWNGELLHRAKDGHAIAVESHLELAVLGDRRLVLESTHDITERKRWEQRLKLLLRELTHRANNTLAVVQSLARQTARGAPSMAAFTERFSGRLSALAGAHKLLVESDWQGTELDTLARSQLQAHVGNEPGRLRIEGPPVMLPPDLATPFGLVLHELATNASKYGAFSVGHGKVDLTWAIEPHDGGRRLKLLWRERDGPAVIPPDREGLGRVLIEKGVPDALVQLDFLPDGVRCAIELELGEIDASVGL